MEEDYDFEKPLSFAFMHCITGFSLVRKLRGDICGLRLKNNYDKKYLLFLPDLRASSTPPNMQIALLFM
jgi:hypothetical protein